MNAKPHVPLPRVSVIMPVLNEERHLRGAVQAILAQEYGGEMEIVIALGPSADRTDEIAAELVREDPRVHTVPNPTGRTPAAPQRGDQGLPPPDRGPGGRARHALAELHRDRRAAARGDRRTERRRHHARRGRERLGARGRRGHDLEIGVGNAAFHTGGDAGPAETVYLGVFRRPALEQQGGYNEEFIRAQDWELNFRIREAGGLIWFSPELKVSYRPRPSVRALAKQYKDYGRWRHVVARYHEGSINLRYLAPPTAVCAIAAGVVVGAALTPWAFLIPAGYLAAIALGSLPAGKGLPLRSRLQIPVALATMHMSWGWGFLTSPKTLAKRVIASRRPAVVATPTESARGAAAD